MEVVPVIGNLYLFYGEYYLQLKKSLFNPPLITTMIDTDYIRIKNQYYINAVDYIQANCGHDIWIYSSREGIVVELATNELKSGILLGFINHISDSYYIKYEDDMFKIIFNKN